jgi:hypothetical protein
VPSDLIERMRRVAEGPAAAEEGIAIASAIGRELRSAVQGIYVSTPTDGIDAALAVVERVRA